MKYFKCDACFLNCYLTATTTKDEALFCSFSENFIPCWQEIPKEQFLKEVEG